MTKPPSKRGPIGTSARALLAGRRQAHAAVLRSLQLTYAEIADARLPCPAHQQHPWPPVGDPGCKACLPMYADKSGARRAVEAEWQAEYALNATGREQHRQQHLAQLDQIIRKGLTTLGEDWRRGPADERWTAARTTLRAMDQRARILGLYAPSRIQVTTELDEQIRAELEALGLNDPVALSEAAR